jgi:hypothetical protein
MRVDPRMVRRHDSRSSGPWRRRIRGEGKATTSMTGEHGCGISVAILIHAESDMTRDLRGERARTTTRFCHFGADAPELPATLRPLLNRGPGPRRSNELSAEVPSKSESGILYADCMAKPASRRQRTTGEADADPHRACRTRLPKSQRARRQAASRGRQSGYETRRTVLRPASVHSAGQPPPL